jgi:hypothetical protein
LTTHGLAPNALQITEEIHSPHSHFSSMEKHRILTGGGLTAHLIMDLGDKALWIAGTGARFRVFQQSFADTNALKNPIFLY